jgi:hypothetical protein
MNKNLPATINWKAEKDKFIAMLKDEGKRYDVQSI